MANSLESTFGVYINVRDRVKAVYAATAFTKATVPKSSPGSKKVGNQTEGKNSIHKKEQVSMSLARSIEMEVGSVPCLPFPSLPFPSLLYLIRGR